LDVYGTPIEFIAWVGKTNDRAAGKLPIEREETSGCA
jgi:hypothetical protein